MKHVHVEDGEISVNSNEEFIIEFIEFSNSGYIWDFSNIDKKNIESFKKYYEKNRNEIGNNQKLFWHFKFFKPGEYFIAFFHQRPWESYPIDVKLFLAYVY